MAYQFDLAKKYGVSDEEIENYLRTSPRPTKGPTPETQKGRGLERFVTGAGKFVGVEPIGRGLGLAAFRHLDPTGRELAKKVEARTATPEEYRAYADIFGQAPTTKQVAGSALGTFTTIASFGLPIAKTARGAAAAGAAIGLPAGAAQGLMEDKSAAGIAKQAFFTAATSAVLSTAAFGIGKAIEKALQKTPKQLYNRALRVSKRLRKTGREGTDVLIKEGVYGDLGDIAARTRNGIDVNEFKIWQKAQKADQLTSDTISHSLDDMARKFELGHLKGPKGIAKRIRAIKPIREIVTLDDLQAHILTSLKSSADKKAVRVALAQRVGGVKALTGVNMTDVYRGSLGSKTPPEKFTSSIVNRLPFANQERARFLLNQKALTNMEANELRRILDNQVLGARVFEGDPALTGVKASAKTLTNSLRQVVQKRTATQAEFKTLAGYLQAQKSVLNAIAVAEGKGIIGLKDLAIAITVPGMKYDVPAALAGRALAAPRTLTTAAVAIDRLRQQIQKIPADKAGMISRTAVINLLSKIPLE